MATLALQEIQFLKENINDLLSMDEYIGSIQSCRKEKFWQNAIRLHTNITEKGLESHKDLGNHLVPMLVECACTLDAHNVFQKLEYPNEYCWTSLIDGYIQDSLPAHALMLFQNMEQSGTSPSRFTLMALLRACIGTKDLRSGQELHVEIVKKGFDDDVLIGSVLLDVYSVCDLWEDAWEASMNMLEAFEDMSLELNAIDPRMIVCCLKACGLVGALSNGHTMHAKIVEDGYDQDPFVGNTLLDMYFKCGLVKEAEEVFAELPVQDSVPWNIMIHSYVGHGLHGEALYAWRCMQLKGVSYGVLTLVCALKACASTGALERGREVHLEIVLDGFERDLFVSSTLVDMYAKCGSLEEAQEVFDEIDHRNVVAWNALITGYVEQGCVQEALGSYQQMEMEGVSPNHVTLAVVLKGCGIGRVMDRSREIHSHICKVGHENNSLFHSLLVDAYTKNGFVADARDVFNHLPAHDVVVWTALIGGYIEIGLDEEALLCVEEMRLEGTSPNTVTYTCSLKACVHLGAMAKAWELHVAIVKMGYEKDLLIGNMLLDVHAKCGSMIDAQDVFERMPVRSVVSWTALMQGYTEQGLHEEAWTLWKQEDFSPTEASYVCALKLCTSLGMVGRCHEVHENIVKEGFEVENNVSNMLVDAYAKCGALTDACDTFNEPPCAQDVLSWNALLAGYACQGELRMVLSLVERMTQESVFPDDITFLYVLVVCGHAGFVDEGQGSFEAFADMAVGVEHHNCVAAVSARAGRMDEAVEILRKAPFQFNLVALNTVLGACRMVGDLEVGRGAFDATLMLSERGAMSAPFVAVSNIYAIAQCGFWDCQVTEYQDLSNVGK